MLSTTEITNQRRLSLRHQAQCQGRGTGPYRSPSPLPTGGWTSSRVVHATATLPSLHRRHTPLSRALPMPTPQEVLPCPEVVPAAEPLGRAGWLESTPSRLQPTLQGPCRLRGEGTAQGVSGQGPLETRDTKHGPRPPQTRSAGEPVVGPCRKGGTCPWPAQPRSVRGSTARAAGGGAAPGAQRGGGGQRRGVCVARPPSTQGTETLRTHAGADLREVFLLHPHREASLSPCSRPRLRTGRPPGHRDPSRPARGPFLGSGGSGGRQAPPHPP